MRPSRRVAGISLSTTIALDTRAKELIAAGRDVINMSVGEPDFDAPASVQAAARSFVGSGKVRYTPAPGTLSLRKTIAAHLAATRAVEYAPDEIVVCHSGKHALSGALLTLIEPGDEVLLLVPAWVSYVEQVRFAGGEPVEVPPRADLGPDLDRLRSAITRRTRGIVINSPCNPSGYVASESEMRAITALCEEHDLWIVSDEIYRRLVYEGPPALSPASAGGSARSRCVIVDGASKSFAMTGYRIGYAAAPRAVASAIGNLHSQLTGCPNAISQAAFETALQSEPPEVASMVAEFDARRRNVLAGLEAIGLEVPRPRGAFYVFPDVSRWLDARRSAGFCADLLEAEGLALVPGSAFGMDAHVRLSYSVPLETIEDALARLARFLARRPTGPESGGSGGPAAGRAPATRGRASPKG